MLFHLEMRGRGMRAEFRATIFDGADLRGLSVPVTLLKASTEIWLNRQKKAGRYGSSDLCEIGAIGVRYRVVNVFPSPQRHPLSSVASNSRTRRAVIEFRSRICRVTAVPREWGASSRFDQAAQRRRGRTIGSARDIPLS